MTKSNLFNSLNKLFVGTPKFEPSPWPFRDFSSGTKVNKTIKQVVRVEQPEPTVSLAEEARENGVNLLYHFDREYPKAGGYTIAYRPSKGYTGRKAGKMVDVSVSYCSDGDVFSKKIGRDLAISNMVEGKYIQVPAMAYGEDYLHACLREMFSWDI